MSDGTTAGIVMSETIDADGDPFVRYEPAPIEIDTAAMESDLLDQIASRAAEFGLSAKVVATLTADCSSVTDETLDAYYSCTIDDGVQPAEIPVTLNADGTYIFSF